MDYEQRYYILMYAINSSEPAIPPVLGTFLMLAMGWRSSSLTEENKSPLVHIKQGAVPVT